MGHNTFSEFVRFWCFNTCSFLDFDFSCARCVLQRSNLEQWVFESECVFRGDGACEDADRVRVVNPLDVEALRPASE